MIGLMLRHWAFWIAVVLILISCVLMKLLIPANPTGCWFAVLNDGEKVCGKR